MDKYIKRWVEWCDSCGHGFKIDAADDIKSTVKISKVGIIGRLLKRKLNIVTEDIKPKPSACPVCGKVDDVTVIKLQEDKIAVPDNRT